MDNEGKQQKLQVAYEEAISKCLSSSQNLLESVKNLQVDDRIISATSFSSENGTESSATESLLRLKNLELSGYLAKLALLIAHMELGESIEGNPLIMGIVKHRLMLEKIRVFEKKFLNNLETFFSKEIGKKSEKNGENADQNLKKTTKKKQSKNDDNEEIDSDELPSENDEVEDEEEGEESGEELSDKKGGHQKLRHNVRMAPDGSDDDDENGNEESGTKKRQTNKLEVGGVRKRVINELRQEFSDRPSALDDNPHEEEKSRLAKRRFEEANFIRLPETKREKNRVKQLRQNSGLDAILAGITAASSKTTSSSFAKMKNRPEKFKKKTIKGKKPGKITKKKGGFKKMKKRK